MRTRARTAIVPRLEGLESRFLPDAGLTSLLITLKPGLQPNYWTNPIQQSSLIKTWDLVPGLGLWSLPTGTDPQSAMATISKNVSVARVELNKAIDSKALFNDPQYVNQWYLNNTGQNGGTPGADIKAQDALAKFSGNGSTIVAIIDSGVDYNNSELSSRMWINPGEIPGNGIDDDRDGIVDDVYGANFVNGSGNPMDDNGHGTHVAGIIAATAGNGLGIVGIDPHAKIMAIKFLDSTGNGSLSGAISALDYAVGKGARLSNNSWGGAELSPTLSEAIDRARSKGHIVVAAAGNDSANIQTQPIYPASFSQDNIVTVASSSNKDQLSWFSNYGSTSVDIAAPGDNILSTLPGNTFGLLSGTSMATPMVTGALALLWDRRPDLSYQDIIRALNQGVDKIPSMAGKVASGGRLNVAKSLAIIDQLPVDRTLPYVISTDFLGDRSNLLNSVRMEFSEPMDSVGLASTVQVKSPSGTLIPVSWLAVTGQSSKVFLGSFADQTTIGSYSITISSKAKDLKGNLLDQNRNNIGGELADGFTFTTKLTGSQNYANLVKTPIRDLKVASSTIAIPSGITAQRLQISLNISHTDVSDLLVTLKAPWGQTFTLINRDVSGTNLRDMVIEDFATTNLAVGVSPYRGTYRPSVPMGSLGGKSAAGNWTLSVTDKAVVDQGAINSWSIRFVPEAGTAQTARLRSSAFLKLETASGAGAVSSGTGTALKSLGMAGAQTNLPDQMVISSQIETEKQNSLANHLIREADLIWDSSTLLGKQAFVLHDRGAFLDHLFMPVSPWDVVVGTAATTTGGLPAASTAAGNTATTQPFVTKKAESAPTTAVAAVIGSGPLDGNSAVANRGESVVRTHDQPGFVWMEMGLGE